MSLSRSDVSPNMKDRCANDNVILNQLPIYLK